MTSHAFKISLLVTVLALVGVLAISAVSVYAQGTSQVGALAKEGEDESGKGSEP